MRIMQLFSLVALPLAAPMPAATHHQAQEVRTHLEQRATLIEASQFNFTPFNLTNLGMECVRPTADDMYACELRCKYTSFYLIMAHSNNSQVDWHDPNSVRQNNVTGCSCISKWSWDGNSTEAGPVSESYTMCYKKLPVFFEFRIATFNSSEDFSLEIAHRYHDSEYVAVLCDGDTLC